MKLWNPLIPLDQPDAVQSMDQHQGTVTSVCVVPSQFSLPGSATVQEFPLVCSADTKGVVNVWNVTTGEVIQLVQHPGSIQGLAPLPGGLLLSVSQNLILVHDLQTRTELCRLVPDQPLRCVAAHPTEPWFFAGHGKQIHAYVLEPWPHHLPEPKWLRG